MYYYLTVPNFSNFVVLYNMGPLFAFDMVKLLFKATSMKIAFC